ncbi:preprotein translocase subunit YajC [Clostridium niameyense]|uniref:Preprotein translocase subunit YajC n=1 Tax=Clostridium niameyense TaxID=1622073 RepID=A0A6M0R608_9CLOT|nr:preprotein translocase subunit YajC [Clostridium niameyense]NEZ45634.1 preprotein translocase subunit YajC [Clostridium niameyense]
MQQGFMGQFMFLIVMLVLFYLMIFLPEKKRKKNFNEMINSLSLNDEIITRGGIVGKVVNIQDNLVIVQTGPERTRIQVSKSSVYNVTKKRENESADVKEKEDK